MGTEETSCQNERHWQKNTIKKKNLTHCLASPLPEGNIFSPKSPCRVGNQPIKTHPMTAKAGSSWRSKGKSRRKRVLKRAVMVSGEETNHRQGERRDGRKKKTKKGSGAGRSSRRGDAVPDEVTVQRRKCQSSEKSVPQRKGMSEEQRARRGGTRP